MCTQTPHTNAKSQNTPIARTAGAAHHDTARAIGRRRAHEVQGALAYMYTLAPIPALPQQKQGLPGAALPHQRHGHIIRGPAAET